MSRTDKTKPWRVRVAEHNPVPEHDHRDGICDLPDSPLDNKWRGCHWSDFKLMHGGCCWGCGCSQCNDTAGRRAKRKKERQEGRRIGAREIMWGDERYSLNDPPGRPPRRRKDTSRWCKGKEGRQHVDEVRWAHWADSIRAVNGKACYEELPGRGWRVGWHCYHEVGCAVCGKILEHRAPTTLCPVWLEQL